VPLAVIAPIGGRAVARIGPRLPNVAGFVLAAGGLGLVAPAGPSSGYAALLLPAFLAWGVGLGVLTPAVVAASVLFVVLAVINALMKYPRTGREDQDSSTNSAGP
jgi:DHA2 family methylenomycin A resistance protein-like MFS transporter